MEKMNDYILRYFECYEKQYTVSANSEDEAKKQLLEDIRSGNLDGPDQCYDSGIEIEK